jgi:hypothetical protein
VLDGVACKRIKNAHQGIFLMQNRFKVVVTWDHDAELWVADSDDIPGLAAEAPDHEALSQKLATLIPELLTLNKVAFNPEKEIEIVLSYRREERLQLFDRLDDH